MSEAKNPAWDTTITQAEGQGEANAQPRNNGFSVQGWVSASFILLSVALASKGLGFVREVLVAKYFGVSGQVDAFMVAMSLPMMIGGGIGIAFSTALVPAYQKVL